MESQVCHPGVFGITVNGFGEGFKIFKNSAYKVVDLQLYSVLNGLAQNDPILVDALKNYYLSGPVDELPYNIEKYRLDPTLLAVSYIKEN